MAGTFGLKRENYRASLRAGWELISRMREPTHSGRRHRVQHLQIANGAGDAQSHDPSAQDSGPGLWTDARGSRSVGRAQRRTGRHLSDCCAPMASSVESRSACRRCRASISIMRPPVGRSPRPFTRRSSRQCAVWGPRPAAARTPRRARPRGASSRPARRAPGCWASADAGAAGLHLQRHQRAESGDSWHLCGRAITS